MTVSRRTTAVAALVVITLFVLRARRSDTGDEPSDETPNDADPSTSTESAQVA